VEKLEHLHTIGRKQIGAAIMENSIRAPTIIKKKKKRLPYDPAVLLLGIYPKKQNHYLQPHWSIIHNSQVMKTT